MIARGRTKPPAAGGLGVIGTVAMAEYRRVVFTRSFLIGLFLPLVLYGGLGLAMLWLSGAVPADDRQIAVIDRTGVLFEGLETAVTRRATARVEGSSRPRAGLRLRQVPVAAEAPVDLLELVREVRAGELFAILEIGSGYANSASAKDAYLRYFSDSPTEVETPEWLRRTLEATTERLRFERVGLNERDIRALMSHAALERHRLPEEDAQGRLHYVADSPEIAFLVPVAVVLLMFISIQVATPVLLNSVIEEKMYRISEVLLSSLTPFQLFAGKLGGGALVGMTFSAAYLLPLGLSLGFFDGAVVVPAGLYAWFFLFLILGLLSFGSIFTGVSAACQDLKDAQNFASPVMIVMIIPLVLAVALAHAPESGVAVVLSMLPPFSPMIMTMRVAIPPDPPLWQLLVALAGNLVFAWLAVWGASRIFRIGILSHGTTPSFREVVRWLGRDP